MEQWYEEDKQLLELEIDNMKRFYPDAQYGFLSDGRMYWKIKVHPIVNAWTLLIVYDSDHPSYNRWGSSIRVFPIQPTYDEMIKMVEKSNIPNKSIPHTYRDRSGNVCLSIADTEQNDDTKFYSAVKVANLAIKWIYYFESGLNDANIWNKFCGIPTNSGENNK